MPQSDNPDLSDEAQKIVSSTNSHIRVLAGPGTGKSLAMKRRVARLLEKGGEPSSILPVTFTRVAAEDLHREISEMGVSGCENIHGTTLHSLALKILMREHVLKVFGRTSRPLNEFEMGPLIADLADLHGGVRKVKKKIQAYESAWARLQHDEPAFALTAEDQSFQRDLLAWLKFHEGMLIGEVIPYLYRYLRDNPGASERTEYLHILVDEFQDMNKVEQGVIELLSDNAHICIVGDDDQSIYSFKHAHPEGIRNWNSKHPDADDLNLDNCWRCPVMVVEMANSLIEKNRNRFSRSLKPMPRNGQGEVEIIQYESLDKEAMGVAKKN